MGAHPAEVDGVSGCKFHVWAPNAREVSVLLDSNGWTHGAHPLASSDSGVWWGFLPGVKVGDCYKFSIHAADGQLLQKADPYAFYAELPEADHNELCGWNPEAAGHALAAVFLEDRDQHPRIARRFELTAEAVSEAGVAAVRVETAGETRVARLLWATMLGDLVSLELASQRGVDPLPVEAIEGFKRAMGGPEQAE